MIGHFATLKKRQNFLDIRRNGFSINCNKLVFNIKKNCSESETLKYGITVSKKIGNAVKRNYIKRLIRAVILSNKKNLPIGYSIEIIPKKNFKPQYKQFQKDFNFFKIKLINKKWKVKT
ncbi:MAG: ribonuclease P protein component [Rickettsiales bacterium]|nr:ribonuclease P protein component [Rickettsiales bacterium]|tara:strand:+ start:22 stop:378 length:357 start_codon:yes stop_codon:yes gene_type:complete